MEEEIKTDIDNSDFMFSEYNHVQVLQQPSNLSPTAHNLLVASSKYGLVFVGFDQGVKVYHVDSLLKSKGTVSCPPLRSVSLPSSPLCLGLSSDGLAFSVGILLNDNCPWVEVFDTRSFLIQEREPVPYANVRLSTQPGILIQDLVWNPVQPNTLATCMSDGSLTVWEVRDDGSLHLQASLPGSAAATAIAWSPKGKQLVVGHGDGRLTQHKPETLQEVKSLPPPQSRDSLGPVLSILWLSTAQFAVFYLIKPGTAAFFILNVQKGGGTTTIQYPDPCISSATHRDTRYSAFHLPEWSVVVCSCTTSLEASLLGTITTPKGPQWVQYILDSDGRAELPLFNNEESFPLGMAMLTCCQHRIVISEQEHYPPMPMLLLLSDRGLLCSFHLVNKISDQPSLVAPPQILEVAGERRPLHVPSPQQPVATSHVKPIIQHVQSEVKPAISKAVATVSPAHATLPPPSFGGKPTGHVMATPSHKPLSPILEQEVGPSQREEPETQPEDYIKMIRSEMKQFDGELVQLRQKISSLQLPVPSKDDQALLLQQTEKMAQFMEEMKLTTESLEGDVRNLKVNCLEKYAQLHELRTHEAHENYQKLVRERCLDPLTLRRLQTIRSLEAQLETRLREAHNALEAEWKASNGHQPQLTTLDTVYRTLATNQNLSYSLQRAVSTLTARLHSSRWKLPPCLPTQEEEVEQLTDSLLQVKMEPTKPRRMSTQLQSKMADFLANRDVSYIKAADISGGSSRLVASLRCEPVLSVVALGPDDQRGSITSGLPMAKQPMAAKLSGEMPSLGRPLWESTPKPISKIAPGQNETKPYELRPIYEDVSPPSGTTVLEITAGSLTKKSIQLKSEAASGDSAFVHFKPEASGGLKPEISIFSLSQHSPVTTTTLAGTAFTKPSVSLSSDTSSKLILRPTESKPFVPISSPAASASVFQPQSSSSVLGHSSHMQQGQAAPSPLFSSLKASQPTAAFSPVATAVRDSTPPKPLPTFGGHKAQSPSLHPAFPSLFGGSLASPPIFGSTPTAAVTGRQHGLPAQPLSTAVTSSVQGTVASTASTPAPTTVTVPTSLFSQVKPTTASSLFGQLSTSSLFGQTATAPDSGQPASKPASVFGQTSPATSTTSSVVCQATPPSTTVFGQTSTTASVLGQTTASTTSASVFGQTTPSTTTAASVFGQTTPSATTSASVLGQTTSSSTTTISVLGQTTSSSTTTASVLGQTTSSTTTTASVLGQTTPPAISGIDQTTSSTTSASVFSQASPTASTTTGSVFSQTTPSSSTSTTPVSTPITSATPSAAASVFIQTSAAPASIAGSSVFGQTSPASTTTTSSSSVFGQTPASTTSSVFGQTSPASTPSTTFGQSSAAPVSTTASVFGQATTASSFDQAASTASGFGQPPTSGFGQSTSPPLFGQSSTPTTSSTFGKSPTSTGSVFGQTSTPTTSSGFQQGSTGLFGQQPSTASTPAFGQTAVSTASGTLFGKPATTSVFGQSTFGQTSAFGQPPTFGQTSQAFGQSASSFGQQPASSTGLFGKPAQSSFGQPSTSVFGQSGGSSLFGQGAFGQPTTTTIGFGQQQTFGQTQAFGQQQQQPLFGKSIFGQPPTFGQATSGSFGQQPAGVNSLFGAGAFSGLGGTSSPNASKNIFSSFGQPTAQSANLFGGQGAQAFGSPAGGNFTGGSFTSGGSVAQAGFGTPSPQKPGGFGSAAAFGSTPAFGSSPSFGGAPTFGATPMGDGAGFGSTTGFAAYASTPTNATFGALAAQTGTSTFGSQPQQQQGFGPGFGSSNFGAQPTQQQSPPTFGGTPTSSGAAFSQWR